MRGRSPTALAAYIGLRGARLSAAALRTRRNSHTADILLTVFITSDAAGRAGLRRQDICRGMAQCHVTSTVRGTPARLVSISAEKAPGAECCLIESERQIAFIRIKRMHARIRSAGWLRPKTGRRRLPAWTIRPTVLPGTSTPTIYRSDLRSDPKNGVAAGKLLASTEAFAPTNAAAPVRTVVVTVSDGRAQPARWRSPLGQRFMPGSITIPRAELAGACRENSSPTTAWQLGRFA